MNYFFFCAAAVALASPLRADVADQSSSAASTAWAQIKADADAAQSNDSQDEAVIRKQMTALQAELLDFETKYPTDANAIDAAMLRARVGDLMLKKKWPGGPTAQEIDATFNRLASDPNLPRARRGEIRAVQLNREMDHASDVTGDNSAQWTAIDDELTAFAKEFGSDFSLDGQRPVLVSLRAEEIELVAAGRDSPVARGILQKFTGDPQPEIALLAKQGLEYLKQVAVLKTKPFQLQFTAVDGRKVDIAALRGKVVVIDFWATWCPSCIEELPDVIAAYQKFHARGLEIVGISLDQDKDTLVGFTARRGMAWPQYFDGEGWDNKISHGYGIGSVPTMWLIDPKGMLVSTQAGNDLAGQVEKLLKTTP